MAHQVDPLSRSSIQPSGQPSDGPWPIVSPNPLVKVADRTGTAQQQGATIGDVGLLSAHHLGGRSRRAIVCRMLFIRPLYSTSMEEPLVSPFDDIYRAGFKVINRVWTDVTVSI